MKGFVPVRIENRRSIDVERVVKSIKGCVLTKQRNKIADGKAVFLFRLSENLKQLHDFKVEFKKGSSSALVELVHFVSPKVLFVKT